MLRKVMLRYVFLYGKVKVATYPKGNDKQHQGHRLWTNNIVMQIAMEVLDNYTLQEQDSSNHKLCTKVSMI